MNLPPDYRPREGDVLILHGVVKYDVEAADTNVHLTVDQRFKHSGGVAISLDQIVGIHCRHWNEGEKVRSRDGEPDRPTCVVLATHGNQVWLAAPNGETELFNANELVPAVEAEPEMPTDEDIGQVLETVAVNLEHKDPSP